MYAFDTTAKGVTYTFYIYHHVFSPNCEIMILTSKYLCVPSLGTRPSLTHPEVFNERSKSTLRHNSS